VQFKKISIFHQQKGLESSGGGRVGGFLNPQNVKKCMKLDFNFQRSGVEIWEENIPSVGKVWTFFWNYMYTLHPLSCRHQS